MRRALSMIQQTKPEPLTHELPTAHKSPTRPLVCASPFLLPWGLLPGVTSKPASSEIPSDSMAVLRVFLAVMPLQILLFP
jgi:hypothetical protein